MGDTGQKPVREEPLQPGRHVLQEGGRGARGQRGAVARHGTGPRGARVRERCGGGQREAPPEPLPQRGGHVPAGGAWPISDTTRSDPLYSKVEGRVPRSIAHHVTGCHLIQETRVHQIAVDDRASNIQYPPGPACRRATPRCTWRSPRRGATPAAAARAVPPCACRRTCSPWATRRGHWAKVGRCSLTVSKPVLKAPIVSALEARI